MRGKSDVVALLLEAGADPERRAANGSTPLGGAVYFGQVGSVASLLNAGADINAPGRFGETPLMLAVRGNHPELLQTLLQRQADVNVSTESGGHTALLLAVDRGLIASVKMLLAAGSDVYRRDSQGRDALVAAMALNDPRLIRLVQNAMGSHQRN